MNQQQQIFIDPLSAVPLFLLAYHDNAELSSATGFILIHGGQHYLITNWHVVSGRHTDTEQPLSTTLGLPNKLKIVYHTKERLGAWQVIEEPLYNDQDQPLWIEHPNATQGQRYDVVALRLQNLPDTVTQYPLDMSLADKDVQVTPATTSSIIGYPNGLTSAGMWPIWKTGHIATDFDLSYKNLPVFLIDATTRAGMSGSPVILRVSGGYSTSQGNYVIGGGIVTKFLGVYSGRIDGNSEIGMVWKPKVITEILSNI